MSGSGTGLVGGKRIMGTVALVLCAVLILCASGQTEAEDDPRFVSDGLSYTPDGYGGFSVGPAEDCPAEVVIQPYVMIEEVEYPVLSVGGFSGTAVVSVVIPDGVISVEPYAFADCVSLEAVTIGSDVEGIGAYAFAGCTSLKAVELPDGLEELGEGVFSGSGLTEITVPGNIDVLGPKTFSGCMSLRSAELLGNSVGAGMFSGCRYLTETTWPDTLTHFGDSAFDGCIRLADVQWPSGLQTLGYASFRGCAALTDATLPEGVRSIGDAAFSGCSSMETVSFHSSVAYIGEYAFSGCASLDEMTVTPYQNRDSVWIGANAFSGCPSGMDLVNGSAGGPFWFSSDPDGYSSIGQIDAYSGQAYYIWLEPGKQFYVDIIDGYTTIQFIADLGETLEQAVGDWVPESEGLVFDGYYTDPGCVIPYEDGPISSHLRLFTGWTEGYSVTYLVDGMRVGDVEYHAAGETVKVMPRHTETGYTVSPWTSEQVDVSSGSFTMPAADVTISAVRTVDMCTVTLDTTGGEPLDPIVRPYNHPVGDVPEPVRDGYLFTGWYTDPECTVPYGYGNVTADITVYAGWEPAEAPADPLPGEQDGAGSDAPGMGGDALMYVFGALILVIIVIAAAVALRRRP